jgi:hypothetical protein
MNLKSIASRLLLTAVLAAGPLAACGSSDGALGEAAKNTKDALRETGELASETATKTGRALKDGAKTAGDNIGRAVDEAKDATNQNLQSDDADENEDD